MVDIIELEANDLAAMLSSKICHDLINPVGAINNGLETLADPEQEAMAEFAKEMIASAAKQAQARLEFARIAYGASSTAGSELDSRECERVAKILFAIEKPSLNWNIDPVLLPKNKAKLLMNMLIIALAAVPRGGEISVNINKEGKEEQFEIISSSNKEERQKTIIPLGVEEMLKGNPKEGVDARSIQPFYTGLLARLTNMEITVKLEDNKFTISAIAQNNG